MPLCDQLERIIGKIEKTRLKVHKYPNLKYQVWIGTAVGFADRLEDEAKKLLADVEIKVDAHVRREANRALAEKAHAVEEKNAKSAKVSTKK